MPSAKKVLVVENDEVILTLISHILARHAYEVRTTTNAFEADELLQRESWDAVLMDLKLPGGGTELIRKIAEKNPPLLQKIIVVTGAIQEAEKLADLPLHAILRKPFEVGSLVETVRTCVEGA